jgi:hypothetical protein
VKRTLVIGAGVLLAAGAAGTTAAVATGDNGDDGDAGNVSVTGPQAQRATAAALDITGGGHANSVERDGENGATWEVEVTRPDGVTVDVRLDERYALVVVERDGEDGRSGG